MYINHVALPVEDVDRAREFYVDWFDARVVPSPNFGVPVAWVLLGKVQIHMVQHPGRTATSYHFAVGVEDATQFAALYRRAEQEQAFDLETFPHHIFELPGGDVQMWIRDVSGNVVEVDHPDANQLGPDVRAAMKRWSDDNEQSQWNQRSSLFMPEQAGLGLSTTAVGTR